MPVRDLFDESGRFVTEGDESLARTLSLFGRSVHVFVFDAEGRLLICRRAASKRMYPSLLTSSAGWGVDHSESFHEAAQRELMEETGLRSKLSRVGRFDVINRHERTIHELYECFPSDEELTALSFDRAEVAEHSFAFPSDIVRDLADRADAYAPPFVEAMELYVHKKRAVLDFDHTLFDWYRCKAALVDLLSTRFGLSLADFERTKDESEAALEGKYFVEDHMRRVGAFMGVGEQILWEAIRYELATVASLYPDARDFLERLHPDTYLVTVLTYGHEANQQLFMEMTLANLPEYRTIVVTAKAHKNGWARRLACSAASGSLFVNDDPGESAAMADFLPSDACSYVVERPDAKYTNAPVHPGYSVVRSLGEIVL